MLVQLETQIRRNPYLELIDIRDNMFEQADFAKIIKFLSLRAFAKCIVLPSEQNIEQGSKRGQAREYSSGTSRSYSEPE